MQMETRPTRRLRCAIYTRKSSEEGLDMEFNSLDPSGRPARRTSPARNLKAGSPRVNAMTMVASLGAIWTAPA